MHASTRLPPSVRRLSEAFLRTRPGGARNANAPGCVAVGRDSEPRQWALVRPDRVDAVVNRRGHAAMAGKACPCGVFDASPRRFPDTPRRGEEH